MPRKIRQLAVDYRRAGFVLVKRGGKGSHRKYRHPLLPGSFILAGQDGEDALDYKERDLQAALAALDAARKQPPPR